PAAPRSAWAVGAGRTRGSRRGDGRRTRRGSTRGERGAFVLGVPGLAPDPAPVLALRRWRLGRPDDVGRGGLGGGGGVLARRGELPARLGNDLLDGGEFRLQGIHSRLEATTIRAVGRVLGSHDAT